VRNCGKNPQYLTGKRTIYAWLRSEIMLENLATHLKAQQEPLKKAIIELARIPSVCNEGGSGYPFGEAIDQALRKTLQLAGKLGFKTHYGDGG
jgi:hypothetical protein